MVELVLAKPQQMVQNEFSAKVLQRLRIIGNQPVSDMLLEQFERDPSMCIDSLSNTWLFSTLIYLNIYNSRISHFIRVIKSRPKLLRESNLK